MEDDARKKVISGIYYGEFAPCTGFAILSLEKDEKLRSDKSQRRIAILWRLFSRKLNQKTGNARPFQVTRLRIWHDMDLSRNQESVGRLNTKCATCSKIDAAWQYCLHTADNTTIISAEFIETKASRLRYVGIFAFDNSDAALRWNVSPQSVTTLYAIKSNIKQQKHPVQCFRATVRNHCDTSSKWHLSHHAKLKIVSNHWIWI